MLYAIAIVQLTRKRVIGLGEHGRSGKSSESFAHFLEVGGLENAVMQRIENARNGRSVLRHTCNYTSVPTN